MADTDPNKSYLDTRANVRETSKWIVGILGATIVLVVGGGLIAKVPDLDLLPRIASAIALLILAAGCIIPLKAAIDIVGARTTPFRHIALSDEYGLSRAQIDSWLEGLYPPGIDTVSRLYIEHLANTALANNDPRLAGTQPGMPDFPAELRQRIQGLTTEYAGNTSGDARQEAVNNRAIQVLGELQPRVREVIELCTTERLQQKFAALKEGMNIPLAIIGAALFIFLVFSHKEDATEKPLTRPIVLSLAWSADVEAVLKTAGLEPACYATKRPQLIHIADRAGLRAVVIAVPDPAVGPCRPVRVIVTNDNTMYAD